MIKNILGIVLLILPLLTHAVNTDISFNLRNTVEFDENQGEVYLPVVEIDLLDKETKVLNLSISDDGYFIFSNDQGGITSTKSSMSTISLEKENKVLKIEFNDTVTGKINLEGVKIRTYDEEIRDGKIGLDYNNDNEIDNYTNNIVNLDENGRFNDNMYPLPVSEVINTITKNSKGTYDIVIKWKKSPDLDTAGTIVKVNQNNSYGNLQEKNISLGDEQIFEYTNMDLEKNIFRIEILSKDFYYETKNPYIITLDKSDLIDNIKDEVVEETQPKTEKIEEKEIVKIVDKYIPRFINNKNYTKIAIIFDNFINRKLKIDSTTEKINKVMVLRNNLLIVLEKYDTAGKLDKKNYIVEFRILLISLINELK